MDSIDVYLRVNKKDIYLICPFFEAFEGMVSIRTPKPEEGEKATIKLMVSPDFKEDFNKVLESLKRRIDFELVSENN
jgi:Domain of unknown function (DUF4911)